MKNLPGIKISHKISSLMIGLVVGFLLMAVAYYAQIASEKNIADANAQFKTVDQLISATLNAAAEIRAATPTYVDSGDEMALSYFRGGRMQINETLHLLESGNARYVSKSALGIATESIKSLDSKFNDLVQARDNYMKNTILINDNQNLVNEAKSQLKTIGINTELFSKLVTVARSYTAENARAEAEYNATMDSLKNAILVLPMAAALKQSAQDLVDQYDTAFKSVVTFNKNRETLRTDLLSAAVTMTTALQDYRRAVDTIVKRRVSMAEGELTIARAMLAGVLLVMAIGTTLGLFFIYRSIVLPLWHMQAVIAQQNSGNDKARVKIRANDELGDLGRAFNRLLDERIKVLSEQSHENETLNTSIIGLIRALGLIARKDLTVKVPVSADVTGTVSDAVNLLTSETARTLQQVKAFSEKINDISNQLQAQSEAVVEVAEEERAQVAETVAALDQSAKTMSDIAKEARSANTIATAAIANTLKAQLSVTQTVEGIQIIRGTISETEKRIKRLGDRSQEITSIVNLINTIAERTHILALNASMHAASAGEAGKGFAVVAEEVQRLAENARGATSEISAMVNNIRVETSDTVSIMNKLITQVAEGTKLAEDSGQRMHETESATRQLVNHVKSIAVNSINQANMANRVRDRALLITESTEKTHGKLEEQRLQTDALKGFAHSLVERVSVFTLPESRESVAPVAVQQKAPVQPIGQPTANQKHLEKIAMGQVPPESNPINTTAKIA